MIVVSTIVALREQVARRRQAGQRIAFVPTMGNLHAGHLRLMSEARRHASAVVASIFVNPLQFGANEDFDAYPRTPAEDHSALESAAVDLLFTPTEHEMYPGGAARMTTVEVPELGDMLCGSFRPGHFRGVATVVNRLFNLVQPDVAIFGKKDYQQLAVIRQMVGDLGMPVQIVGVETVREGDGLALSSRNQYLTGPERALAPSLYATLVDVGDRVNAGAALATVEHRATEALRAAGFRPDYVSIRRQSDLTVPATADQDLVVLAAAWLGRTRLIDNLEIHRG